MQLNHTFCAGKFIIVVEVPKMDEGHQDCGCGTYDLKKMFEAYNRKGSGFDGTDND